MSRLPSGLKFSLVELLVLILVAGLAAAALRSGGALGLALVQGTLCLFVVMSILALVARESWQAFAIGFVLGVAGYGLPVVYVRDSELNPYTARLPLTKASALMWEGIVRDVYVDPQTGEALEEVEVTTFPRSMGSGVGPDQVQFQILEYQAADGRYLEPSQRPFPGEFLLAAHACFAIAFGYVGGKFAAVVYRRKASASSQTAVGEND